MSKSMNLMLVGVGGQGIILASEVLSEALMLSGLDVKKSEIHGMAQRGGSVRTDVRCGEKVWSPLVPLGEADVLLAFEQLEACRYLPYLRPGGTVVLNTQVIVPTTAISGAAYPQDVPALLATRAGEVLVIEGEKLAAQAGNVRAAGTCLLGAMAPSLPVLDEQWRAAFEAKMPSKLLEVNWEAFRLGREACA